MREPIKRKHTCGKSHVRRFREVSEEEFEERWDLAFGKKKKKLAPEGCGEHHAKEVIPIRDEWGNKTWVCQYCGK